MCLVLTDISGLIPTVPVISILRYHLFNFKEIKLKNKTKNVTDAAVENILEFYAHKKRGLFSPLTLTSCTNRQQIKRKSKVKG